MVNEINGRFKVPVKAIRTTDRGGFFYSDNDDFLIMKMITYHMSQKEAIYRHVQKIRNMEEQLF